MASDEMEFWKRAAVSRLDQLERACEALGVQVPPVGDASLPAPPFANMRATLAEALLAKERRTSADLAEMGKMLARARGVGLPSDAAPELGEWLQELTLDVSEQAGTDLGDLYAKRAAWLRETIERGWAAKWRKP